MVVTGATFGDAVAEFLRHAEQDRQLKPSTLRGYRSIIDAHLSPAFGKRALEKITSAEIEQWRSELTRNRAPQEGGHGQEVCGGVGRQRKAADPADQ